MSRDAQDGSGGLRRPLLASESSSHAVELAENYGDGFAEADVGPPAQTQWAAYLEALGEKLGLESAEEGHVCFWLGLQAHLANSVFTIGRNVGPTLFIAKAGAAQLPVVMFASGVAVLATGPLFARFSRGKRAAKTNRDFSLFTAGALLLLPIPLAVSEPRSPVALACAYALFLAEDLLPMMLMMQSSSLAQCSLTGHAAKRLLGLIQLGCSTGAMTAGLAIGPLAHRLGATNLLVVQAALLVLSLYPNAAAWYYEDFDDEAERRKEEAAAVRKNKTAAGQNKAGAARGAASHPPDQGGAGSPPVPVSAEELPLWRSPLLVALALNTFGIILCKTIVEFQYNVLVSDALSVEEMVTLTGQLYAAAGLLASLLNVLGSPMLRSLGITSTLVICPAALCLSALIFASAPVVAAAFIGRLVDLTLRWSINNSTKSLLWIATPRELQIRGKPIIEGLVKKATASLTALLIGLVALLPVPELRTLALLSAAVSAASCVVCYASGRLYHSAVWSQIERRELVLKEDEETYGRHYGSSGLVEFEATVELNASTAEQVLDKLRTAPPQVQLYILRGVGDRLPDSAWRRFLEPSNRAGHSPPHLASPRSPRGGGAPFPSFSGFDSLTPGVQVEALRMCERAPARLSNHKLLQILEQHCRDPTPSSGGALLSSPLHSGVSYEPPTPLPLPPPAVEAAPAPNFAAGWAVASMQGQPRATQPCLAAHPPSRQNSTASQNGLASQNRLGAQNSIGAQKTLASQNGLGPENSLGPQNSLGPPVGLGGGDGRTTERVAAVAILAVGGRRLQIAEPLLARLLESRRAAVRAAAAAALLRLGWGVGLGHLTTTALAVLEGMAGVPLGEGDDTLREQGQGGEQSGHGYRVGACQAPDGPPAVSPHTEPAGLFLASEGLYLAGERVVRSPPRYMCLPLPASPIASRQSSALRMPPAYAQPLPAAEAAMARGSYRGGGGAGYHGGARGRQTPPPPREPTGADAAAPTALVPRWSDLPPPPPSPHALAPAPAPPPSSMRGQMRPDTTAATYPAAAPPLEAGAPDTMHPGMAPGAAPTAAAPLIAAPAPAVAAPSPATPSPAAPPPSSWLLVRTLSAAILDQLSSEVTRLTTAWDELSARDPAAAMPLALRLTRLKGRLAAARAAADTAGGGAGPPAAPPGGIRRHGVSDCLVAVNMLQALPPSLLPVSSLLSLLHSDSHAVRRAALPLLSPALAQSPYADALIRAALACAEDTRTEHRARRALCGLARHGGGAVAARVIQQAEDRLKGLVQAAQGGGAQAAGGGGGGGDAGDAGEGGVCPSESGHPADSSAYGGSIASGAGGASPGCAQAGHDTSAGTGPSSGVGGEGGWRGHPSLSYAGATRVRGLCGVVCEMPGGEGMAERMLAMSASLNDPEIVHELLDALIHLWPRRPAPTNVNLEAEIRQQTRTLLYGFFVFSWLRAPAPALSPPSAARLAFALGLPPSLAQSIAESPPGIPAPPAPPSAPVPRTTSGIPRSSSAPTLPRALPPASFRTAAADPAAALRSLASDYVTERQYLQRLRLFKLSMLWRSSDGSVPGGGRPSATGLAPSKVLAAWRVLRSDDPKAASAALEVLETTLAPRLAALVLPLVNDAVPLERKLRVAAAAGRPEQGWMRRWFELTCDPLGRDLAPLCDWLRAATGRRGAAAVIQARARERRASSAARAAHASSPPVLPERAFAAAPPRPLPPPAVSPTHAPAPLASHEPSAVALTSEGVAGALASAAHRAVPASLSDAGFPPPTTGLAARVLLLRGSRLFRGVLTLHVAAVAQAAQQVTVTQGQRITKPGASYFVMEGKARREPEEVLSSRHPHRNTGMSGGAQPSVGAGDPSPVPFGSSSEPAFTRGSNATGSFSAGMCLFSGTSFSAPAEASAPPASPAHPPSLASPAHHPPSLAPPAHHPPSLAAPAALHGPPLREYVPGDAIQELGCFDHTLPVVRCVATCPSRCLVLPPGLLWRLILTLPPKFGLSLLRALVTFAPSASHGAAKLQQENSAQVADRQSQLVQPRGVQSRGAQSRMVQPGELRPPGVASQRAEMACGYIEGRGRGQAGGVAAGGAPAVGRGAAVGTGVASGGAQVCVAASEHGLAGRAALPELPEHVEGAEGAAPACGGEACSSVGEAGVREAPDAVYAQAAGANAQAAAVNADAESAAVSTAASHVCACEGEASEEEAEEEGEAGGGGEVVAAEVEGEGEGQAEGARIAFSRDERAWLLRQVKLLRFVHRRFIPSLADIVSELRLSPGQHVCTQGDPTPGRLFIVAHGALQLWRSPAQSSPPVLLRELTAGDSLGNTGLIADGKWEYTAVASQDSWALSIARDDLADLLRGRSDLSLSVLKGFYLTFVRRLTQVLEQEGRYSRAWLLAADVDKSPMPMHRGKR